MYTIEDISKMTGLSISIISRYMNGYNVRKENKIRIEEAVKKTGYTPNEFARSLRAKRTKVIGAIIPSLKDNFSLAVLQSVENALKKRGYSLFIADCFNSAEEEVACVQRMLQKRVDALIVLPIGDIAEISRLAKKNGIPLIIFDQYFENISADYILFENKAGAYRACEVLLENGHRNIGVLIGPLSDYTPRQRLKGFKNCMKDNGFVLPEENIFEISEYSMQHSYEVVCNIFRNRKDITAIFSTNFDMTLGVIKAVNELGINIPQDFSLMAFDSLEIYEIITPKLWTINQPIEEIANHIAMQVFSRLSSGDDSPYTTFFVKYELKEGASIQKII